ncbi:phage tail protein I [Phreatobacter stygius]|uniref:phage tail protein I n=1 Tax=Phreatobacter stygius TaxID=1940610 RepID=UPI0014776612|nr:phage tail protein I [Phreatobacter stygius]
MTGRVDRSIVPPSVSDERGRAFGEVLALALEAPDFRVLLTERIDTVDASVLPFLVRELSIEDMVEPGMTDAVIRRVLKGSFALHARKGYVDSVIAGLGLLGVRVTRWRQWFQETPQAAIGTHVISIAVDDEVFEAEGRAITARLQRAIGRMIDATKRYSQDITIRVSADCDVPLYIGAATVSRIAIRPSTEPITTLAARPPVFVGVAMASRLRIQPKVS